MENNHSESAPADVYAGDYEFSESWAKAMDAADPLASYRSQYHIPPHHDGETVYFTGNSLGLQPKKAWDMLREELEDWQRYGVEGHFEARRPWFAYHEFFAEPLSRFGGRANQ